MFDIQERVSRSIMDALEIRLTPQEAAQLAERPIADVRAQESYLRARSEIWSFMPGGLDLAISHLEAALRLIGDNALIYQGLGEAYFQYVNIGAAIGREEEFIHKMALGYARRLDEAEALTEGVAAQPDSDVGTWWMGLCRAAWRTDRAEVLRLADGPCQQLAAWDAEVPWLLASAHAAVGAKDEALLWLDRAIERGMINYPFLSEHDWHLNDIRGEPRFRQAMERAKGEWERFEV